MLGELAEDGGCAIVIMTSTSIHGIILVYITYYPVADTPTWEPIRLGRTDGQTDGRRDPISWSRYLITTPSGFESEYILMFLYKSPVAVSMAILLKAPIV